MYTPAVSAELIDVGCLGAKDHAGCLAAFDGREHVFLREVLQVLFGAVERSQSQL